MSISKYPRVGQLIGPHTLKEVLKIPITSIKIPSKPTFADLDETVWTLVDSKKIATIVREMFSKINLVSLPEYITNRNLPSIPNWVKFEDIELEQRTYNCLKKNNLLLSPQHLGKLKIFDMIKLVGFGKLCLFDLLTSLEFFLLSQEINNQIEQKDPITNEIKKLENINDFKLIHSEDSRFKYFFKKLHLKSNNLFDGINEIVLESFDFPNKKTILQELVELTKQIRITNKMFLEFELEEIINKSSCKKHIQILMKYCGWDGKLPKKLREVSKEFHISPEYVRQIYIKLTSLGKLKHYTPALVKAINFIESQLYEDADIVEKNLILKNITYSKFRIESIIFAAKVFDLNVKIGIAAFKNKRLVVLAENAGVIYSVNSISRKIISHWGVSTIAEIASRMKLKPKLIHKALSYFEDFRLLDKQTGWFWLESVPRNSLLTQINKILVVSRSISLTELRIGVSRPYHRKGFAPPKRVLLELCKQIPWCKVDNDIISASFPIKIATTLNKSEMVIFTKLAELGFVQQKRIIEEKCIEAGMSKNNFTACMSYCPFIYKYCYGVYGILGADILPGVVDSLKSAHKPRTRIVIDFNWTDEGKIKIIFHLSEGMISSGVFGIPAGIKEFLQGEFNLKTSDGTVMGTLKGKNNSMWGLLPFFHRRGGDPGDYLLLIFDLSKKESIIDIGDENIREDFEIKKELNHDDSGLNLHVQE